MVSKGVGLVAVLSPALLMLIVSIECWHLRAQGHVCQESKEMAGTVGQMSAAAFAWMATPPQ